MKLKIIITKIVIILFVYSINLTADTMKKEINLSGEWFYKLDKNQVGITGKWFEGKIEYDGRINVPGFFEGQINKEFDGWIWYFKVFDFNEKVDSKIALYCEAIDDDASIWLNGEFIGEHQGYSESFYFEISQKINQGKNFLAILVKDYGGPGGIYKPLYIKFFNDVFDLFKTELSQHEARKSLDWVSKGIIYEIFPRSFSKNGDFNSIIKNLPRLKDLGVTILWLMPIHPIGVINRKGSLGSPYSVKDYYDINPEYGTKEDFKKLVQEAHRLGFKVIIDEVLNHCAWDNLVKQHPDWFTKDKEGKIISPNSDWTDVVDFNYDNQQLRKYMIEMLSYWVKEFDIDGFRFDVSELVPLDFWEEARVHLEKLKPQFWLSEGTLPEHHLKAFDMTYSWNIYDLFKPILDGKRKPQAILHSIQLEKYQFPKNSLRMRFNENHDKMRSASVFGYNGSFITAAIVFSINGVPLVHAGQEVGEKVFSSLFEKTEIQWGNDPYSNEHYKFFKQLISLRKRLPELTYGQIKPVEIDEDLLAFTNSINDKGILAIFNFSDKTKSVDLNFIDVLKTKSFDLQKIIGKKFKMNEERMGRPADKIFDIDPLGFMVIEFQ